MKYPIIDIIEFIIAMVNDFAIAYGLSEHQAYRYIRNHDGISFIENNYGIMHTLDYKECVESIARFCQRKGGKL